MGHDFTGPYSNRKFSKALWIEFSKCDTVKDFLKHTEKENFVFNGTTVKIKFARTQFQKKRNYAMRKAEELLKASPKTGSSVVTTEWKITESKDRRILVNGVLAFSQAPYDGTGTFLPPFFDLSIDYGTWGAVLGEFGSTHSQKSNTKTAHHFPVVDERLPPSSITGRLRRRGPRSL